ncbi:hypothetical protein HD806DRAFT_545629 [Xylariaceae sp. AK1471]|nr:hypothetical protein HD806DRAFT_545629 [Xylariaceae sp. AK1471]
MSVPRDKESTFARAAVWSDGLNDYTEPEWNEFESVVSPTTQWVPALERIQAYREAFLTAPEIDEAVAFRENFLPTEVKKRVNIFSAESGYPRLWNPNYRDFFSRTLKEDKRPNAADENQIFEKYMADNVMTLKETFSAHPYHMWPINTGDHWEVVFVVLKKSDEDSDEYDTLSAFTVVDPRLPGRKPDPEDAEGQDKADIIIYRLGRMFELCDIGSKEDYFNLERLIWVPEQGKGDNWSCGLRAIWFVWEILIRLQDMETSGIRDTNMLFRPMRPYFNPDYVRLDAAGAIAARGLNSEDFRARIAVARVTRIVPKPQTSSNPQFNPDQLTPKQNPPVEKIPQEFLRDASISSRVKISSHPFSAHRGDPFIKQLPDLFYNVAERISTNVIPLIEHAREKQREYADSE